MNTEGGQRPGGSSERTGYVIAGVALIVAGIWFLGGRWLSVWGEPLAPFVRIARDSGWPLLLIILGVVFLVWSAGNRTLPRPAAGARLMRSREKRMVGGVIGGLSDYLQTDVTLLRVITVLLSLAFGVWPAAVAYIAALIIMPEAPASPPAVPGTPTPPSSAPPPPPPGATS